MLPTHPDLLHDGQLQWPGDDAVLNLVGMRLVNESAQPMEVASHVTVRVPPVAVLVLLKMASYLDRPHERHRDLQDLVHVLREYPPADDDRRYTEDIFDRNLDAQQAGPYVLGKEIRALNLTGEELHLVERFFDALRTDEVIAVMTREVGVFAEAADVIPLLDASRLGFDALAS